MFNGYWLNSSYLGNLLNCQEAPITGPAEAQLPRIISQLLQSPKFKLSALFHIMV